tara:strand:+ start:9179 stop:9439 length:261 start_codon:yes stop_codon:yes gene_type:complete
MPNNTESLIKTVSDLPWSGLAKVIIFIAIAGFYWDEYKEDNENSGSDTVQRDLSVFTLSAIESLRATIEAQEGKQDDKIEVLQEYH